ncbi:nucleotidyltransferase domain-containing protein [Algoriphagus chordae]|uniref:Nucleotidyltransferase-like protein n=1 Tax=Algoriphagus chordae TaxID=237019 RepID=A0A2W7T4Q3_9BACT|nr:nucleotidyltransferase domain-containing protein [Algoriphagus chordae]PZX58152.1 nucleotidyltransferase-like protein [Algoriphagus chordae]
MAESEVVDLLKKFVEVLKAEGISVSKAFLYGSYSEGTAISESDIDVLLVSDEFEGNNDLLAGKIWRLTSKVSSRIEPFLVGTSEYEDSNNSPLVTKVKEVGIQIV